MKKDTLMKSALIGLLSSGCSMMGMKMGMKDRHPASAGTVHCKGVATKWVNDCGTNHHKCAGQAKSNFSKHEWLKMNNDDCMAVQEALKNKAVRMYIEKVQKGTVVATKRGKKF